MPPPNVSRLVARRAAKRVVCKVKHIRVADFSENAACGWKESWPLEEEGVRTSQLLAASLASCGEVAREFVDVDAPVVVAIGRAKDAFGQLAYLRLVEQLVLFDKATVVGIVPTQTRLGFLEVDFDVSLFFLDSPRQFFRLR